MIPKIPKDWEGCNSLNICLNKVSEVSLASMWRMDANRMVVHSNQTLDIDVMPV